MSEMIATPGDVPAIDRPEALSAMTAITRRVSSHHGSPLRPKGASPPGAASTRMCGWSPNVWLEKMELVTAERVGQKPARYVRNIFE